MTNRELENRLMRFAVMVLQMIKTLPEDRITNHLIGQLIRSGASPSLNYGEALGAESKKDFTHKLGIVLKELRESLNCMLILAGAGYLDPTHAVIIESNELISIFVKSVETAKKRLLLQSHKSQVTNH